MPDLFPQIPVFYDYKNVATAVIDPNTMHITDTRAFWFWQKYFLKRAIAQFKFTLPKEWSESFFKYILFERGYICVFNTPEYGTLALDCILGGRNVYYEPSFCVVSNPALDKSYELEIDEQCALVKIQPDYSGITEITSYFAAKAALLSQGIDMNLINSKLAYVFISSSKTIAETFKKLYDEITAGNPAAVIDKDAFDSMSGNSKFEFFNNNLRQNYIVPDMLDDLRTIENEFDSFVGIPNSNTQKRERLITDEVNANNIETQSLLDMMLDSINSGFDKANTLFKTTLHVERKYNTSGGDTNAGNIDDNRSIPV